MPRRARGLTASALKTLPAGRHADGGGLYLVVAASGARSWLCRYLSPAPGRRREMGLGSLDALSLSAAREQVTGPDGLRHQVTRGVDPLDAAVADMRARHPFRQVAQAHIAAQAPRWRSAKHAGQWTATLETYAYPRIGDTGVADISVDDVVAVLSPIWSAKPETAARVRQRIEAILAAAIARGWRTAANPADAAVIHAILPRRAKRTRSHHAALPYRAVPALYRRLSVMDGMAARALRFAILTAGRTGEVREAVWDEIDPAERLWIVPATRMKAEREHRVPLSGPALSLLRDLETIARPPFIFWGQAKDRPLSTMAMLQLLRRLELDVTVHGFRSSFRDWAAEQTDHANHVVEMALAHTIPSQVEAAYRRGELLDKRRALMADWAAFVTPPSTPDPGPAHDRPAQGLPPP